MQYQEYISLLEAFRLSLTAENDPNIVQIVEQINKTVANLKTGKYYAVALTSQLFDVVSLVENLMAFNDLKLNTIQFIFIYIVIFGFPFFIEFGQTSIPISD